jgi:polar amino acid transport system permease protein
MPHFMKVKFLFVFVLMALVFYWGLSAQAYHWDILVTYRTVFFKGWLTTVVLSSISLVLSLCIGIFACLLRKSHFSLFRCIAQVYVELIRGTPLLVQLLIFFYIVAFALNIQNRYVVGVITLSLFNGAYIAEIFRSGFDSVRKTMLESATAIGLNKWQTYRYVIFPISIRQTLPPLAGQFTSIIKDSSLLSILGISEFTYAAQQVNSASYSTIESYFPLAIGYLILTLPVSLMSRYLEKRSRHEA